MKRIYLGLIALLLQACYGVNERTSEICDINQVISLTDSAWSVIFKNHNPDSIKNSDLIKKSEEFKEQPFSTDVLYFKSNPEELIGIDPNHYSIRYIYDDKISDQVLNGLSPQLQKKEKQRICKRIHTLLEKYTTRPNLQSSY
ncbi:MAG TPA: hypothetical protein VF598_14485 [Hymenobacter sp.]|jgi:hypothetical protein